MNYSEKCAPSLAFKVACIVCGILLIYNWYLLADQHSSVIIHAEPVYIDEMGEMQQLTESPENSLELAIGRQIRDFRIREEITVADLARQAGLSVSMLSKVENGLTSPSLATLNALSKALNVPVTSFFRMYEEIHEATVVRSGHGLTIERQGTRAGHQYQLLGHHSSDNFPRVEPYLITLTEKSEIFPMFQHEGIEFIYMLEGEVVYRHANKLYRLKQGDSLYFDPNSPHGPEELITLPILFLAVIVGRK